MYDNIGNSLQKLMISLVLMFLAGFALTASVYLRGKAKEDQLRAEISGYQNTVAQLYKARLYMADKKLTVTEINFWPKEVFGYVDPDLPEEVVLFGVPDDPMVSTVNRSFALVGRGQETRQHWFTEAPGTTRPSPCQKEFCKN